MARDMCRGHRCKCATLILRARVERERGHGSASSTHIIQSGGGRVRRDWLVLSGGGGGQLRSSGRGPSESAGAGRPPCPSPPPCALLGAERGTQTWTRDGAASNRRDGVWKARGQATEARAASSSPIFALICWEHHSTHLESTLSGSSFRFPSFHFPHFISPSPTAAFPQTTMALLEPPRLL
ncbi:hypothetical protein BDZ91DRAFT_828359 [Kalaharituber pfeilii]|nr:hypothetical protein BDZ91DRAFT_828359 [Kalaharituber pfeilii]